MIVWIIGNEIALAQTLVAGWRVDLARRRMERRFHLRESPSGGREHMAPLELFGSMILVQGFPFEIVLPIIGFAHRIMTICGCEREQQRHLDVFFDIPGLVFDNDASSHAHFIAQSGDEIAIAAGESDTDYWTGGCGDHIDGQVSERGEGSEVGLNDG